MLIAKIPILALFTFLLWGSADARTVQLSSLEEAFLYSEGVVHARIESAVKQTVNGHECGILYTAQIFEAFKFEFERTGSDDFAFGRSSGLEPGQEYVLFIRNVTDAHAKFEEVSERLQAAMKEQEGRDLSRQEGLELVRCNGLIPGPEYDVYTVWDVLDADRIFISGLLPRSWPPSIQEYVGSSTGLHYISRNDLFNYLRQIQKQ